MPKSGEHDDQVAPRLAVASIAITVSGRFGMKAATRSPGPTPLSRRPAATRATSARSCANDSSRREPRSSTAISAGAASSRCSRFSAKLRRAAGNQRAPGIRSPFSSTGPSPQSATTPAKRASSLQNAAGSSTDQRCSAA